MRIRRRSFEECVGAARSLAEEKPFAAGWGNSGCSEMQSPSSYFPKRLPEITEGESEHAVFPFFSSSFALQEGARHRGK